jgi:hypothetical protein
MGPRWEGGVVLEDEGLCREYGLSIQNQRTVRER